MTQIKIQGKLPAVAEDALQPHKQRLYSNQGARIMGVIELKHSERTEPAPDEDKELTQTEIKHELDTIAEGLWATLRSAEQGDGALPGM